MSSIVTLAEHGIGFYILCNKICVKLSGKHRNKSLTNKQTTVEILQNIVAFSEYMNFNKGLIKSMLNYVQLN